MKTKLEKERPLSIIERGIQLQGDLHILRAQYAATHQMKRYNKSREAPDLVMLAPNADEKELIIEALLEQLHITERNIKDIIEASSAPEEFKDKLLAAIDAGEWVEGDTIKDDQPNV